MNTRTFNAVMFRLYKKRRELPASPSELSTEEQTAVAMAVETLATMGSGWMNRKHKRVLEKLGYSMNVDKPADYHERTRHALGEYRRPKAS